MNWEKAQRWADINGIRLALIVNRYRIFCLKSNTKSHPIMCGMLLKEAVARREELLAKLAALKS